MGQQTTLIPVSTGLMDIISTHAPFFLWMFLSKFNSGQATQSHYFHLDCISKSFFTVTMSVLKSVKQIAVLTLMQTQGGHAKANYCLPLLKAKQVNSLMRLQQLWSECLLIFGPEWILRFKMYFLTPLGTSPEGMPTNSSNKPNIRGITQVAPLNSLTQLPAICCLKQTPQQKVWGDCWGWTSKEHDCFWQNFD